MGVAPSSNAAWPAVRHDRQWLQIHLQQLFEAELPNKELRGKDVTTANAGGNPNNPQAGGKAASEEAEDLAEAVACLSEVEPQVVVRQVLTTQQR